MGKISRFWHHAIRVSDASFSSLLIYQCEEAPAGRCADIRAPGNRLVACLSRKEIEALKLSLEAWLLETRPRPPAAVTAAGSWK